MNTSLQVCILLLPLAGACTSPPESEVRAGSRPESSAARSPVQPANPLAAAASAPSEAPAAPPGRVAQSPAPADHSLTGAIDEEQFKQLHQLRQGAPPELHGQMIDVGGSHAYLALPPTSPGAPGVLVIHEWWGLNDNVKHWADRLASDGYAAVAVDLYGGVVATTPDEAMKAMKQVDDEQALAILRAAHEFLANDARVRAPRRGSIGWCFGGGKSLQLALAAPDLDACVMYYGQPVTDPAKLESLRAPLLGIFGTRDKSIPPAKVREFEEALRVAGREHTLLDYDAEHAFANPSNPNYDEKNAGDAWEKVRAFLAEHLKRTGPANAR